MNDFRPKTFNDIVGQDSAKQLLQISVSAFKKTGRVPSHLLLLGPSGVGKTTLALTTANEMGVNFVYKMANKLKTPVDIFNIMLSLEEGDVLFIDEIHALRPKLQEYLYDVLEDFQYDTETHDGDEITYGKGDFNRFCVIGATTHAGNLNLPLRRRFPMALNLVPYTIDQLTGLIQKASDRTYGFVVNHNVANYLARLSKSNASGAINMLSNMMVIASGLECEVTSDCVDLMVKMYGLDPIIGLDRPSRMYLNALISENRPMGASVLATLINEQEETVENFIEPFLLSDINVEATINGNSYKLNGALVRATRSGREITKTGRDFLTYCWMLQSEGWLAGEKVTTEENDNG